MASRYIALIPAYEPDRRMLGVIADLGKKGFDVVVVDDGSAAEYADLFEQAAERLPGKTGKGVTLLIHDTNRGKGAALRTGLDFIGNFMVMRGRESEAVVVTVDADGQHLAKDAFRAASEAAKNPGTLVLGSRSLSGQGEEVPLRSRFGNAVTRNIFRMVTGTPVYDTQTGLRAFTADLIPELLGIGGDRYEYETKVLMEFAGKGIPIKEIPIGTVYMDGNSSSHFSTVRDSYRIYKEIAAYMFAGSSLLQAAKFSAASFASFLVDYALYALLLLTGAGVAFANVGARLISSVFNYTVNRKLVFRSGKAVATSALQYFALAAFILAGNTFILQTMTGTLGIGKMTAKVLTEVIFFLVSWTVQKYVVFYSTDAEAERQSGGGRGLAPGSSADSCIEAAAQPEGFAVEYAAVRPRKLRDVRINTKGNRKSC